MTVIKKLCFIFPDQIKCKYLIVRQVKFALFGHETVKLILFKTILKPLTHLKFTGLLYDDL